MGVLVVQSYEMKNVFSSSDLVLFSGLADSISMAIGRYRAEQNRRRIESLYNTVVDSLVQGVVMCDPMDKILFANRAFSRIVGIPASELVGRDFSELVSPGTPAEPPASGKPEASGNAAHIMSHLSARTGWRYR